MIIDGEHKNAALRLDLVQSEGAIEGSIMWDDLRREITSGSSEGRKVRIESATEKDKLTLHGLFRNGSIDGRFAIKYDFDPEPFPGIFTITRQQ